MTTQKTTALSDKKLEKLQNTLGNDTIKEMEAMDAATLKKRIVDAQQAKQQVAAELEANPEYRQLKQDLKDISAGKRDVNKRQDAITSYALHLLSERGDA